MLETLVTTLAYAIGNAAYIALIVAISKANLSKASRYKQIFMPVVAIVYLFILLLAFDAAFGFFAWIWQLFRTSVPVVGPLLGRFNATPFIAFAFNIAAALLFLVVKRASVGKLGNLADKLAVYWPQIYDVFYEFDEQMQERYLKERFYQVRTILFACFVAIVAIGCILLVVSAQAWGSSLFKSPFYPVFSAIIMGEFYYVIAGLTKSEVLGRLDFEEDDSFHIVNYGPLSMLYKKLFGARLLADNSDRTGVRPAGNIADIIDPLRESDEWTDKVAGSYLDMLNKRHVDVRPDDISSMLDLLHGKNLIFSTPFYRDYTHAVLFPAHRKMMQGGRVLFVCGPKSNRDRVAEWARESLDFITSVPGMWKIGHLEEDDGYADNDVGIMSFSHLNDYAFLARHQDFFTQCSYVVFFDPSDLITTTQIGVRMLSRMMEEGGAHPTYAAFDVNTDGLVDSLSHATLSTFIEVQATEVERGETSMMMWDADGENLHLKIFDDTVRYLGTGTELAAVALKNQVSHVQWCAQNAVPLYDVRWVAQQYYGQICEYAEVPISQSSLDSTLSFTPSMWDVEKTQRSFMVVEDETNNMFEAYRQFVTRSPENSFVNVISPNYLLRDYMRFNARLFEHDPKAIPLIVPDYVKSVRNALIGLVFELYLGPVEMDRVRSRFEAVGMPAVNTYEEFIGLLAAYFPPSKEDLEASSFEDDVEYIRNTVCHGTKRVVDRENFVFTTVEVVSFAEDQSLVDSCFASLRSSYYIAEDEVEEGRNLGSRLYGHVYQELLPGQFLTIDGKYYESLSITLDRGVLLRRAADHFTRRRYYRQMRDYRLSDFEVDTRLGRTRSISGIDVTLLSATVDVDTQGFIVHSAYGDFEPGSARYVDIAGVPQRNYRKKEVLKIEFTDSEHVTDCAVVTIAFLLNELMRTVFANDWSYIAVTSPLAQEGAVLSDVGDRKVAYDLPRGAMCSVSVEGAEKERAIYVVEDSEVDLGLLAAFDRNLEHFLEIVFDFLDWHTAKMNGELENDDDDGTPVFEMATYNPEESETSQLYSVSGGLLGILRIIFSGRDPNAGKPKKKRKRKDVSEPAVVIPEEPDDTEEVENIDDSDVVESDEAVDEPEAVESDEGSDEPEATMPNEAVEELSAAEQEENDDKPDTSEAVDAPENASSVASEDGIDVPGAADSFEPEEAIEAPEAAETEDSPESDVDAPTGNVGFGTAGAVNGADDVAAALNAILNSRQPDDEAGAASEEGGDTDAN